MKETVDKKLFRELCEKYSVWIIKYISLTFEKPVYMVWFTDLKDEENDKLLTYKSGGIISVSSI